MNIQPAEVEAIIKFSKLGLQALSERVLTFVGMLACIGIFGAVLYDATWVRVACASAFAVLVYWPIVRLESSKTKE